MEREGVAVTCYALSVMNGYNDNNNNNDKFQFQY